MSDVTYRRARPGDFLEIAALDRGAWRQNADATFVPDGEHVWRLWVEHALTFVACQGSELVGAVLAFPCLAGSWCLHKVMVQEVFRGRGIGSGLFRVLLAELDDRGAEVFLTVDPANQRARRLYEGFGFAESVFVSGFYRPEEDRLVLSRRALSGT
ncbi:MAG: GNAT family N-acetyltransferase [Proteobacteria bacterium]|nr:GNAT family N-acetyltransferase [Pseudomonadota bacterium]MBU1611819.1 GNAT family N-acetyltransferase [Pseudomonadota bacterium]